jgi:nicotinate-nucleotide--dimethylbenzimidazole phosphoribosyltransferase
MRLTMTPSANLPSIPPLDAGCQQQALARQRQLTKPSGALGKLEILSAQLAGMTQQLDWLPHQPTIIICAGDHGIADQGVSAYPRTVTKEMVLNFLNGGAAINVLARQMNVEMVIVDAGVAGMLPAHDRLIQGKINYGTADFSKGRAMPPDHAVQAIRLGLRVVNAQIDAGAGLILTGEMGIGNTTAAAAIIAALTGLDVRQVTGYGTGIGLEQYERKVDLIQKALQLHAPLTTDTLSKIGGYEIAALVGVMIGAAARRVPVVLDGVITTAAGLVAAGLAPNAVAYFVAGHRGVEPGHGLALDALGLTPVLELSMRLGEGTGAVLSLPVIEAAMRTLQEMATFGDAGVSGPTNDNLPD